MKRQVDVDWGRWNKNENKLTFRQWFYLILFITIFAWLIDFCILTIMYYIS